MHKSTASTFPLATITFLDKNKWKRHTFAFSKLNWAFPKGNTSLPKKVLLPTTKRLCRCLPKYRLDGFHCDSWRS